MTEYIKGIKNQLPFMYFEKISKIPRASGNEKEIAELLVAFARERGLSWYKDDANNVLITKNATQGRENEPSIMLQAHTDMVAEKNNGTVHDFSKDPIELVQEENILSARGTTLGADDGFGVAIMMSALDDKSLSHPMLECLFTSSEEIGLVGASSFDYSKIKSRRMINLDSASEDYVIIGCCGGVRTELSIPVTSLKNASKGIKLSLGGLCGGHSGEDIDRGRQNANILIGKIINKLNSRLNVKIAHISGGDKDNAIPRECEAIVVIEDNEYTTALEIIKEAETKIKKEITAKEDSGFFLKVEKDILVDTTYSQEDTEKIIKALSCPNGVLRYRSEPPILPETSRNLARVRSGKETVDIGFSSRSYLEERLDESCRELDTLASLVKGKAYHHERYPGWESPSSSSLVTSWQNAFERVAGKKTEATLIHAGLECGLISSAITGLEAISVGCNVHNLHTPQETMEIASMDKIYDAVVEFLSK